MKTFSLILGSLLLFGTVFALKSKGPQRSPGKHVGQIAPVVRGAAHGPRHSLDDVYSNHDTLRIPDFPGDTAISHITVNDTTTIRDLNIYVNIHHTWVRDLYIAVSGPGDTAHVVLLNFLPRDDAVNLIGWFDDQAAVNIMQTDTPLVGEWQPLELLSRFDSIRAQGTWTLRVYDRFRVDSGYVASWSVEVNRRFILTGIVRNAETNVPLSGVRVDLLTTHFATYSLPSGVYGLSGVPSGTYTVQFSKANFDTLLVPEITLDSAITTSLDTALQTSGGYHEFASTAAPVFVPDTTTRSMTLNVPVSGIIGDLDILVNVEHRYDQDLYLWLTSPDSHRVVLAAQVGQDGDNFTNCRFNDAAVTPIGQGVAPFTGSFQPEEPLSGFNGLNMQGLWQFTVADSAPGDSGWIHNFTLYITERLAAGTPRVHTPTEFSFAGNYPNPFNSQTTFRFSVPVSMKVQVTLFNITGQAVARIFDGTVTAGDHEVPFDAGRLPSGVYFARLVASHQVAVHKMLLLR